MDPVAAKTAIVDLLQLGRAQERALVASLGPEQRVATGSVERWSAKVHLGHIVEFKEREVIRLEAVLRGLDPRDFEQLALRRHDDVGRIDVHVADPNVYQTFARRSWSEIENQAEQVFAALLQQVERLSDGDLSERERFARLRGDPLSGEVLQHGLWHGYIHVVEYYREHGDADTANATRLSVIEAMERFPSALWDSGSMYNLACLYAGLDNRDRALTLLRQALPLDPELTARAQEDPDLEPIRSDPRFIALVAPRFRT